jgi:hypothetical protein
MPLKIFTAKHFFGRDNELEILYGIASEAKAGNATSILLSGRCGIGKTELLKQLFDHLFWRQDNVIPFFYTINTAFISAEDFSKDYLCKFILQALAFLKKEPSLINASVYSIEDLIHLAKKSEAQWAVDMLNNYLQIKVSKDPAILFLSAISAPYRCYLSMGMPVIVIIDDFHKTRSFYGFNIESGKNFWMLFEDSAKSRHTPHIFSGFHVELHKMFFKETSFGKHLELVNLSSLDRNISMKLFTSLCEAYALNIEVELSDFINLFNGNPLYIKSFAQAARKAGRTLSGDNLWEIYMGEITKGKIYEYWTYRLKTYIPQFNLRENSLRLLYHLCNNNTDTFFSNLLEQLSIKQEELEKIINLLQSAGIIETGFSTFKLTEDEILTDVIKALYHREILKEPLSKFKDVIIKDKHQRLKRVETPFFEMTTPSLPKAELTAVKALEQVAQYYNVPSEMIGQLQVAMSELFANVVKHSEPAEGRHHFKFNLKGNMFSLEITIPQREFVLTDADKNQALESIKRYLDDIKIERIMNDIRITMLKGLKENFT